MEHNFGEFLRKARESKGVKIEDLSSITKIPIRTIKLLEDGKYDFSHPVFIKGFIKIICKTLSISPSLPLSLLEGELARNQNQKIDEKSFLKLILINEKRKFRDSDHIKLTYFFIVLIFIISLIIVLLSFSSNMKEEQLSSEETLIQFHESFEGSQIK